MTEPLICCITPTRDRPELVARSVQCSTHQWLVGFADATLVYNTGGELPESVMLYANVTNNQMDKPPLIGTVRNMAIRDITHVFNLLPSHIAHFDDDDWSAPDRLSIQLAHIEQTGKLVTGFYDMLFYDTVHDRVMYFRHEDQRFALGTSLFYRREAWEKHKFPDATPEDNKWRADVGLNNCLSRSSLRGDGTPIMIQTYHGKNASARIIEHSNRWQKATEAQDREVRRILDDAKS